MTSEIKEKGLSDPEVLNLQKKYGLNEIEEKEISLFVRIAKKFISPIPLMIEAAFFLSLVSRRWEDVIIIGVLLVINISVDVMQEQKARKALEALKEKLATYARALRNGKLVSVDSKELVPGDIIKLSIGDVIPADAKLLGDATIQVDQSAVTGESLPVERKSGEEIFVSSIVQTGSAFAEIIATGRNSSLGQNAKLVAKAAREEESHFQKAILNIGKFLIALSTTLIIIVLIFLIHRGDPILESLQFVLVLTIASIPVALPAVLSVTMAIGAATLAKKRAVVSHFQSVEELASVDELCVDKTGTLTKNQLAVTNPVAYGDIDEKTLLNYALLATEDAHQSKTEQSIYDYADEHGFIDDSAFVKENFSPFDPAKKTSEATAHDKDGNKFNIIMGAPQVVAKEITDKDQAVEFEKHADTLAGNGFRILAIIKKTGHSVLPAGIIPLSDPPRPDAKTLISSIKEKGIEVRMLTGDGADTGTFIAHELGIGDKNLKASGTKVDENTLKEVEKHFVFSEVVPEDKYNIVDTLQKKEHVVAMTGDGINDAPALKKADVGIAVAGATPAARGAADIVLLDEGISVIKDAIYYARMTFARMQSYALFRISETVRIVLFVTLSVLIFNYAPLSAVMIILLALLNDIPVMSIAYDNAKVHSRPIRWNMREVIFISAILGIAGVIASFTLLYMVHAAGASVAIIQTVVFLKLDIAGNMTLYITRAGRGHFWEKPFPSPKFFVPAFGSAIVGTLIAGFGIFMHPLSIGAIAFVWLYAFVWFLVIDQVKVFAYKLLDKFENKKTDTEASYKTA